ncbi:hypothetical protein D3C71_1578080 [compost metagenome]
MNVHVIQERILQSGIIRDMRQHPQLNLRIVGRQNRPARLGRDEDLADFAAFLQPDRDILQVRELAAQPSGRGNRLAIEGVDLAC